VGKVGSTPPPMAAPLRVLLWSPAGAGLHYGGPGMTAYRLYSKAEPGRFRLTLAYGRPEQERYELFEQQVHIRAFSRTSKMSLMRFVHAGRRWVRDHAEQFDVFHGLQGFDLTVRPAWEAKRHGLPAVVKLAAHRSDLTDKSGWKRWLGQARRRRRLIAQLDAVIAISTDIRDELLGYGVPEDKVALIPNGVDTQQFRPASDEAEKRALRAQLGWPDGPILLFAGGVIPRKQPHLLVEAMFELRRRGKSFTLVLAGPLQEVAYIERIREIACAGGVSNHLIMPGFVSDVAPMYRAADLFSLPSRNEGMPNALAEAMASGLPSIATDISGSRDLVESHHNGFLLPTDMLVEDLAAVIDHYLDHPNDLVSYGQAARRHIEQYCSVQVVLEAHERLFRRIQRS